MVTLSRAKLGKILCSHLNPWRGRYLTVDAFVPVDDVHIVLPDLLDAIEQLGMLDDPLPAEAVDKLDLFEGATFAHAVALLRWAWEQPVDEVSEAQRDEDDMTPFQLAQWIRQRNASALDDEPSPTLDAPTLH
jgi:hypothetical protein